MSIFKRICIILLFAAGIASACFGTYINFQVKQGKVKIENAQKSVDQSKELFASTPYTKGIGDDLTNSFQKQIDQGQVLIENYAAIASWLQMGGVIAALLGIVLFLLTLRKK